LLRSQQQSFAENDSCEQRIMSRSFELALHQKGPAEGGNNKLTFVRIVTNDVAALTRFYSEVIGIAPKILSDAYVEFPTAGGMLAISAQQAMELHGAGATAPRSNRSVVFDFQVEDVDRERARLAALVKDFVLEPANQPWGNRSMLFRDPEGNLINFFAPIKSQATEEPR
jgi:predicted enzyme related to lactoylglutathione lyase